MVAAAADLEVAPAVAILDAGIVVPRTDAAAGLPGHSATKAALSRCGKASRRARRARATCTGWMLPARIMCSPFCHGRGSWRISDRRVLKDASTAELIHAVKVVAAGDALLAPSVTRRLIADFTRKPPAATPSPAALDILTNRETEVLRLIARGMSNTEISAALSISGETAKTHVKRILAKLGLRDRAQAVMIAYESGLVAPGG